MRAEIQAIVLGAGPGMRMTSLTVDTPKCLLPLATLPMITFPLHLLQQAGLEEATVVVAAGEEGRLVKVVEQCGLTISVDSAPVNTSADPGTADSLRHIVNKIKKSVDDVIIISSDLVTDVKLQDILNFHRAHGSALTALTASMDHKQVQNPAPGPKTKPSVNSDVIVTEGKTDRLILVVAGGDYDNSITLPASLPGHISGPLQASTAILDAHLYIVKRGVLEQVLAKDSPCRDMGSFKAEILPYIVSQQFATDTKVPVSDEDYESLVSRYNTSIIPSRHHSSGTIDARVCYMYKHQGLCVRVNTMGTYWDINRRMHGLFDKVLPDSQHPLLHPSSQIHERAQISEDSVVGAGSIVSEKTNITSSVLGNHTKIEPMNRITNSVLGDHTTIASGCVISNSLVRASLERKCVLNNCIVTDASKIEAGRTYANETLEATQDFA